MVCEATQRAIQLSRLSLLTMIKGMLRALLIHWTKKKVTIGFPSLVSTRLVQI